MFAPPSPAPLPRPKSRLTLLTGVYLAVLLAAIVALPTWLAHTPRPLSPRPAQDVGRPTAGADRVPTVTQPAPLRPEPGEQLHPAARQPRSEEQTPALDSPIIQRRWSQGELLPATSEPAQWPELSPTADTRGRLDRSAEIRRRRVQQFGGTPRTEDAVEAGLAWLAAHQDQDGTWDRFEFNRHCPPNDRCPGIAVRRTDRSLRPGLTGLALLGFLGAGYTDRAGPYQDVVARAVNALLGAQKTSGGFGSDETMAGYNDTLATFALAEYYALTQEPRVVAPLERAVTRLVLSQQELGGWDYAPRLDSGRNDTSIAAWAVQALRACVAAGIHVPRRVLVRAALHFARACEPDGRVWYADAGTGFRIDAQTLRPVYRYGPAITAAGLTCEQLLGWRLDSELARRQQALLLGQPPSATLLQGRDPTQLHSYYYWYYGTIAMFQAGGQQWERWNGHLRDAILPLQNRDKHADGRKKHAYGSWPPFGPHWGKWGRMGGRVYTTALCVLTLEIYYRHTPAYLEEYAVLDSSDWRSFLREADQRQRRQAVRALREMRVEVAEPVLVDLLPDGDRSVALAAALGLTALDSPLGRPLLEQLYDAAPAGERAILANALRRAREIEALPPVQGTVRVFDAERRLATLELPRAYVGMMLTVHREGQPIARFRVIKRFAGWRIVVATLVGDWQGAPPGQGDPVISR